MEEKELLSLFDNIEKRLTKIEARLDKAEKNKRMKIENYKIIREAVRHMRTLGTFEKFKKAVDEYQTDIIEETLNETIRDMKENLKTVI